MTQENKTPVKAVSLKSLMTPSKTVEFDYPGFEGLPSFTLLPGKRRTCKT